MNCCICDSEIIGQYYYDDWGNCAHAYHRKESSYNICYTCGRIIGDYSNGKNKEVKGVKIKNDGRVICGKCRTSSIINENQLLKSFQNVIKLLAKIKVKIDPSKLALRLVYLQDLNSNGGENVRGRCITHRRISGDKQQFLDVKSEILILKYLPKILFESVLAHEVLHFWLYSNEIKQNEYVEGFCNIGSALVTNYYAHTKKDEYAKYLRKQDNINSDPYYGINFVLLKKKLQKKGWSKFINEILTNKEILL